MEPIPVYIGISQRFDHIADMTANSILRNTTHPVNIQLLYPEEESGCTGFSNVRYQITTGIYLDVDMIVLGDIAELWAYRRPGRFVCLQDKSTEVAVMKDCFHACRNKREHYKLPMTPEIPLEWNVEDHLLGDREIPADAKLIHYTDLSRQPWTNGPHPNSHLEMLWHEYI